MAKLQLAHVQNNKLNKSLAVLAVPCPRALYVVGSVNQLSACRGGEESGTCVLSFLIILGAASFLVMEALHWDGLGR